MFHPNLCTVKIPQTLREIEDLVYKGMHSEYTYFDTETSGVKVRAKGHDYMIGLAIGFDDEVDDNVYYIPVNHFFEGKDQYSLDARINEVKKLFSTPENPNEWEMLFPYFTKELLDHSYYNLPEKAVMQLFKKVFEKSKTKFVAHNIMFDLHVLQNSGIDVSKTGWDSEMICYPFVFEHKGNKYMLYNGNDYGKDGFGLAVLENNK